MDEAGQRISRFLLTQTAINAAFGAVVTAGLFLIGVPYAALWGACAGILRFVPHLGAFLATLMPTALAFVQFEGWGPTLATLCMFLAADFLTAQVVEPLVVGHRTGVSALALLAMAVLWTWLWGPIGLLLSTPITVVLVVLGKHIPRLEFLNVLLGDAPPLAARVTYYQRLLAHDDDEANEIVAREVEVNGFEPTLDDVLLPALVWATKDRARDEIAEDEEEFILDATRSIAEELAADSELADTGRSSAAATAPGSRRIIALAGRGGADPLATELLAKLFRVNQTACEVMSPALLVSELVNEVERDPPDLIYICALPPRGISHARYVCKRLRTSAPHARIVLVRPCRDVDGERSSSRVQEIELDAVVGSFREAWAEAERFRGTRRSQTSPVAEEIAPPADGVQESVA
jgi:hypothetical protein